VRLSLFNASDDNGLEKRTRLPSEIFLMPVSSRGIACDTIDITAPWRKRGAPIVFVHGIGTSRGCWADWIAVLAAQHPIVTHDLRGFGQSASLPMEEPLLDVLIDDVLDLMPLDEPVHLVGESAGGAVVLELALRHPARIATVTMSNAPIRGRQIGQIGGWKALFDAGGDAWNERMMECRFAPGALDEDAERWYRAQQRATRAGPTLAIADMVAGMDQRAALPGLKPPLMVLLPGDSPFISTAMYDELSTLLPSARRHVFAGVRHGLPFSHGRQCALLLQDFIAAQVRA
jgi:pimeloyl-ACP methyl ester carboxylesterase